MLSIFNRRLLVSNVVIVRPLRFYSVIPSIPQQQPDSVTTTTTTGSNSTVDTSTTTDMFHALYNNENQSIHESHLHTLSHGGVTYRSLSEDDQHHSSPSSSTFGPTFNSVFDE